MARKFLKNKTNETTKNHTIKYLKAEIISDKERLVSPTVTHHCGSLMYKCIMTAKSLKHTHTYTER